VFLGYFVVFAFVAFEPVAKHVEQVLLQALRCVVALELLYAVFAEVTHHLAAAAAVAR
jgi:hypothetical protein